MDVEVWRDTPALERWRALADPPQLDVNVDLSDARMKRFGATDGGPLFCTCGRLPPGPEGERR